MIAINFFDNLGKKNLPILSLILIFVKSIVEFAIIDENAYCMICKFKKILIFVISIKDLEFQVTKKNKLETNPKILF